MSRTIRTVGLFMGVVTACFAVSTAMGSDAPSSMRVRKSSRSATASPRDALSAGNPERALELIRTHGLSLTQAERFSMAGQARFMLGEYVTARRKLQAAVRKRPKNANDQYWLGRAYLANGSPSLAESSFEKAHWHGLKSAELHHYWARALWSSNEVLGKIRRHAWQDSSDQAPPPGSFAYNGLVVGEVPLQPDSVVVAPTNSAIYHIHQSLALAPNRGKSLLLCGELWAAADHHQQAIRRYERAATRLKGADLAACHDRWARSLLNLGEFDGYLKHAKRQMHLSGGVKSAKLAYCYDRAAKASANRGNLQGQIRYLTFAVELKPEVDRLILLADALMTAQHTPDATACLETALGLEPTQQQRRVIKQRLSRPIYLASPTASR